MAPETALNGSRSVPEAKPSSGDLITDKPTADAGVQMMPQPRPASASAAATSQGGVFCSAVASHTMPAMEKTKLKTIFHGNPSFSRT